MAYKSFQQAEDGAKQIQKFLRSAKLTDMPRDMQDRAWDLIAPGQSISFAVAHFAHLVYARRDEVSTDALELAAACAGWSGMYGIDDMGVEDKGNKMMQSLRRQSGEKAPTGQTWIKADDDPKPRDGFAKEKAPPPPAPDPVVTPQP